MADLLSLDRFSVKFKPGQSALGHHWRLRDGDDNEIGRTKLFYEGSGRTMGRLLRATGLSTRGPLHAEVTVDGEVRFKIHSVSGEGVTVTDAEDRPLGGGRRADVSYELLAPGSDEVLATIVRKDKEEMALPIEDRAGERLAVLSKQKLETPGVSLYDLVFPDLTSTNQAAFAQTMYLGFFWSFEYHLLVEQRPSSEPLRTLVQLSPLIAAYGY